MRDVIMCDIDHTIANSFWRDPLIPADHLNGNWEPYYSQQCNDEPIWEVVNLLRAAATCGMVIAIVTAREARYEADTAAWLRGTAGVRFSKLMMRPVGDKSATPGLKLQLTRLAYPLERVAMMIDDREDVLDAFRAVGVPTMRFTYNGA